jgi:hypothetical protein
MLGALAIDVRAGQTDIAQHAVVEVQEQVPAPRPFPPTPKPAREVREQPMQSSGSEDDGQPIRGKRQFVSIQSLRSISLSSI